MSPTYHKKENILSSLLREHSPEGIALLTSEPAKLMRGTILVLAGLLLAGLAWSFIGRADVIVVAQGSVSPGTQEHRIYVPVKGDVSDIYAAEGMPTTKGDVLFRINSPAAIQLLGDAITAQMAVESKQKQIEEFPAKKRAAETELEAMRLKLESDREQHEKRVAESISKLAEEQKLKLEKARADVQKAQEQRDHALRTLRQHERLFNSTGGGGISKQQVEEKRKEYRDKVLDLKLSEVKLGEFELSLNKEYEKRKAEIEKKSQELLALQSKYDSARINLTNQERSLRNELRLTQAKARIASRVKFDDIDEDNYLRIRAPIDGVITQLTVDKVGEKVDDKKPIAVVAPGSGNKYLDIKIDEKNRAFLKVGMNAKIKINAFPYQRYGFLEGELEYIAPTTQFDPVSKKSIYKARISLERDYFTVNGVQIPLRYGMQGKTEIAVRKRKLIDLAIDPLRSVAG
jgi:hemolysin D